MVHDLGLAQRHRDADVLAHLGPTFVRESFADIIMKKTRPE
ncbi:hypothetical protein [Mycobacterium palustre]|nr:hypothetical protein [Mycobacterium palustre]